MCQAVDVVAFLMDRPWTTCLLMFMMGVSMAVAVAAGRK